MRYACQLSFEGDPGCREMDHGGVACVGFFVACGDPTELFKCKRLDLIHRSLSDFAIHLTAGIIGEAESILSYVDGPDWQVVFLTF
jgi:hypothetical protein